LHFDSRGSSQGANVLGYRGWRGVEELGGSGSEVGWSSRVMPSLMVGKLGV
jgi:hypothetical protein